jgi:hypothetical protein
VPTFFLTHHHEPDECRFAYAAWHGFDSPLRHQPAACSCADGGHRMWWTVEAVNAEAALTLLPPFLSARSTVEAIHEVPIP